MFHIARAPLFRLHKTHNIRLLLSCNGFSSDSNAPGDGNDKPKPSLGPARKSEKNEDEGKKSSAALNRLNELLAMMNTEESELKLAKKVDLPRPKSKKPKEKKVESDSDSDDDERPKDLAQATRKVATALGGDAKRTESELLSKLLGTTSASAEGESNLTDIITGMVVDKNSKKAQSEGDPTRSSLVKKSIDSKRAKQRRPMEDGDQQSRGGAFSKERYERKRAGPKQPPQTPGGPGSVKLFDEEPLGIFTELASLKESPDILRTWQKLNERELRLAVTHPPSNYFQKMALWTDQGKLWKFPINNEQGREVEAQVPFTEHVFLEEHLESWCPKKGPIRHFMELVCVGLSKNHYITAREKRDHLNWFRDYFEQKKEILKDIIVAESGGKAKEIDQ